MIVVPAKFRCGDCGVDQLFELPIAPVTAKTPRGMALLFQLGTALPEGWSLKTEPRLIAQPGAPPGLDARLRCAGCTTKLKEQGAAAEGH